MTPPKLSVTQSCYLCGSQRHQTVYRCSFGVEANLCHDCGFLFAARRFDPVALRSFLTTDYAGRWGDLDEYWNQAFLWERARRRIELVSEHCQLAQAARVLEVGSSVGHFLFLGRDRNWEMVGLEPDTCAAAFARQKTGAAVHEQLIEDYMLQRPPKFDLVSLFHVLEHIPEPSVLLEALRDLLRESGVLCIEVPNGDTCGDGDWGKFFEADETHQWFFSLRTLSLLLRRAGFEIVQHRVVPAYSGPHGGLLVLAHMTSPVADDAQMYSPYWASSYMRRLKWQRWNWRFGTGVAKRLYKKIHYIAWYVVKGRRKLTANARKAP